jgi:hypothetical protein
VCPLRPCARQVMKAIGPVPSRSASGERRVRRRRKAPYGAGQPGCNHRLAGRAHPALRHIRLWPFDGPLRSLLAPGNVVIAETYPASAMAGSWRTRSAARATGATGKSSARGFFLGLTAAKSCLRIASLRSCHDGSPVCLCIPSHSRRASFGSLSSPSPMNFECRRWPSGVHSTNSN